MDRCEAALGVQPEPVGQVERRQDHVQRSDGKPAEPVHPGGDAVDVLGEPRPAGPEGRVGVGRRAAGAVRHHRRQLGQEQAKQPAGQGDDDGDRNRGGAQRGDHHRRYAGHQDRAGQTDHKRTDPIGFALQTVCDVFLPVPSFRIGGTWGRWRAHCLTASLRKAQRTGAVRRYPLGGKFISSGARVNGCIVPSARKLPSK